MYVNHVYKHLELVQAFAWRINAQEYINNSTAIEGHYIIMEVDWSVE